MTVEEHIKVVLDHLRSALGTGEAPPGSNSNFIVNWYNLNVAKIGDGPWCEMTNTWSMWTAGAKQLKNGRAYTVYAAKDATLGLNGSSWHWDTAGMRAGDQVYYDWSGCRGDISKIDHTGTVEKVNGDGTFYVLEGNVNNMLRRMRRDDKYVVGYVRFNWAALESTQIVVPKKVHTSPSKPAVDRRRVSKLQALLEVKADGYWGRITDTAAAQLRNAGRAKAGYPTNAKVVFGVRYVQDIIDTPVDGVWGPKSQRALNVWVANFQRVVGVTGDGSWGPKTDNAYLAFRKASYNR